MRCSGELEAVTVGIEKIYGGGPLLTVASMTAVVVYENKTERRHGDTCKNQGRWVCNKCGDMAGEKVSCNRYDQRGLGF